MTIHLPQNCKAPANIESYDGNIDAQKHIEAWATMIFFLALLMQSHVEHSRQP